MNHWRARELWMLLALVFFLRAGFWNQAIQGDDVYYLAGAQHALVDPLHPSHARYYFLGQLVDMRGHSHPPLNSWMLAGLLALFGTAREIPLHAAYTLFSLVAVTAAWMIARRHTPRPGWAVLLLMSVPAFFVNGNSLEADLPFLAFWLTAVASLQEAFAGGGWGWILLSSAAAACAGLTAYQSVLLALLLGWMAWQHTRRRLLDWLPALAAPAALAAYQMFEFASAGEWPLAILAGYLKSHGFQAPVQKVRSAAALTAHLAWVVFPALALAALWRWQRWRWLVAAAAAGFAGVALDSHPLFWLSFGAGVLILLELIDAVRRSEERFVALWTAGFFVAGSARYLLPLALPLAILVSRRASGRWLASGFALQMILSAGLALVNYQHWDAYRRFALELRGRLEGQRVWVNSEWGLRHYLEELGARVPGKGESIRPGDTVVSSRLAIPVALAPQGGAPVRLAEREVTSGTPLRLIALESRSAFSVAGRGLLPFEFSRATIDVIQAERWEPRAIELSVWTPGGGEPSGHLLGGVDPDGWTRREGSVALRVPPGAAALSAAFTVADQAVPQRVELLLNGEVVGSQVFSQAGSYTIAVPLSGLKQTTATAGLRVDRTFRMPPDERELGVLLLRIGFEAQPPGEPREDGRPRNP
jgi:hypothetical protein